MKDYTNTAPVFSESIRVTETSDPAHADNINAAPEQLLQNTLVNRAYTKSLEEVLEKLLTKGMISVNFHHFTTIINSAPFARQGISRFS